MGNLTRFEDKIVLFLSYKVVRGGRAREPRNRERVREQITQSLSCCTLFKKTNS